jgi:hypothetical protein
VYGDGDATVRALLDVPSIVHLGDWAVYPCIVLEETLVFYRIRVDRRVGRVIVSKAACLSDMSIASQCEQFGRLEWRHKIAECSEDFLRLEDLDLFSAWGISRCIVCGDCRGGFPSGLNQVRFEGVVKLAGLHTPSVLCCGDGFYLVHHGVCNGSQRGRAKTAPGKTANPAREIEM